MCNFQGAKEGLIDPNIFLLENHYFLAVVSEGLYVFDLGYFRFLDEQAASIFIKAALDDYSNNQFYLTYDYREIYQQLLTEPTIQNQRYELPKNENALVFLNGTYYADTDHFEEAYFSREDYCFSIIRHNYDPYDNHNCRYTQDFLKSITHGNDDLERLLWETIGYIISNYSRSKSLFVLIGSPNSGKSTIISFIQNIIGSELCCSLSPKDLLGNFTLAELHNKKLCVDADMSSNSIGADELAILKKLTSGGFDQIQGNKKFRNPFYFTNECKFLFASNNMLTFKTTEDITPITNRLVILPFVNSIPSEKQDSNLLSKLIVEKNYCINMSLKALHSLRNKNFQFEKVVDSKQYITYGYAYQPLINFLNECCYFDEGVSIKSLDFYEYYKTYCIANYQDTKVLDINQVIPFLKKQYPIHSDNNGEFRSLIGIAFL